MSTPALKIRTQGASIVSTTRVIDSECYHLSPANLYWPISVDEPKNKLTDPHEVQTTQSTQKVRSTKHDQMRESTMVSQPVTLTRVSNASVYLTGGRHLIRAVNGDLVSQHRVGELRQSEIPWQTHKHLAGTSLILGDSAGAQCYYHWMLDLLPKLGYLSKTNIDLDSIDHFLVRSARSAFQIETLRRLGIDSSRIVETANHPYFMCDDIIHLKLPHTINMTMNRFVPNWVKQTYGSTSKASGSDEHIKLYIQRPEGARRCIHNEHELLALLQSHGFHVTTLEGLSVYEQAALLEKTKTLVAAHGSALTNMVFADAGTNIIELFGSHVYPYYRGLANLCEHPYHAVLQRQSDVAALLDVKVAIESGSAENQAVTQQAGFSVDVDSVDKILKNLN